MTHHFAVRRARRATTTLLALGLAAAGLAAAGGTAQADDVEDVAGTVTNAAGAPLVGAQVGAYVQAGNRFFDVETSTTDATGRYSFTDLDPTSRATNFAGASARDAAIRNATTVKLYFVRGIPDGELHSNPGYLARGYGGAKTLTGSTPVPVSGGAVVTANQALPTAAGLVLRITGPAGAPVTGSGSAGILAAGALDPLDAAADYQGGGSTASDDDFYDNPATPDDESVNAPADGLVYVYGLEPGSYVVQAGGNDAATATAPARVYVGRFVGGNGTYAGATPFTATAGAFASLGAQLTDVLPAIQLPRILGDSSFGSTLVADPGVFLRQQGTEFRYQWTRSGAPVAGATGPTYLVTKADKKKKIGLVVTAISGGGLTEFVGSASAAPTSKVGERSKVTAKKAPDYAFTVNVKAKKKKLGPAKGKVVLLTSDYQVASKKAKLRNGSATVAPKREFLGESSFIVQYLGGGKLGSDTATAKLGGGGGKKKK